MCQLLLVTCVDATLRRQDEKHVQGIWRRCSLEEYRKAEPEWELVLDLDALSEADGVSWVWGGSTLLDEGPDVRKDTVMISVRLGQTTH